jgi:homoserine kinase type II
MALERYQHYQQELAACPQGIIHGDLFRDNVLFEGSRITGVIDFYHACSDALLYDLAVIVNDWAVNPDGSYIPEKVDSVIRGYEKQRPWNQQEVKSWPYLKELAALRFWISRLNSRYLPGYQSRSLSGDATKNPDEMLRILTQFL